MDRVNIAFAMPAVWMQNWVFPPPWRDWLAVFSFIGYLFLQVPGGKIAVHGSGKEVYRLVAGRTGGDLRLTG